MARDARPAAVGTPAMKLVEMAIADLTPAPYNPRSVYRRVADGYWVAAVSIGGQRRRTIYGRTRAAVAAKLVTTLRAQQQGIEISSSERLTVGAYLKGWIEGARATVRASTWYRYGSLVGHLTRHLGGLALVKLQPADCAAAFAAMSEGGLAPRTIMQARAVLGRALREAEIAGIVARNAARLTRPPHAPHAELRTLTTEQARALLEAAAGDRLGALYAVALASGARQGELLALRWSGVDWDRGAIRIQRTLQRTPGAPAFSEPKTPSSRRTIPLGRSTMDALRRHRVAQAEERPGNGLGKASEDALVFATPIGTPIDAGNLFRRTHYPLLERAGLPALRFHDLRHSAATLLLEAGVHPRAVAERLGHASPSMVMNVYGHATERMQEQATAAMERVLGA